MGILPVEEYRIAHTHTHLGMRMPRPRVWPASRPNHGRLSRPLRNASEAQPLRTHSSTLGQHSLHATVRSATAACCGSIASRSPSRNRRLVVTAYAQRPALTRPMPDASPHHSTRRALVWMRCLRRGFVSQRAESTAMHGQHSPRLISFASVPAERLSACQIPVYGANGLQTASYAPLVGCRFKHRLGRAPDRFGTSW